MKKSYLTSENFSKLSTTSLKTVRLFLMVFAVCLFLPMSINAQTTNTWNGSSSSNWNTAANWSLNLVPTSAHNVVIPNGITTTISVNTAAVCNTFIINSGNTANNVTISGTNSLTVTGAVTIGAGTGSADDKLLNVGAGTLSCSSITVTATGSASRISGVTLSTGTVNSTGNVTMGDVNDDFTFTGSGTLNVGGSFTGGTFTASTGTVNYNKAGAQSVGSYTYNNLILSGSGAKTIGTTASGTLTSGNLSIAPTGTATASITNTAIAVNTLTIGGLLTNSGTYGSTSSAATNNSSNTYFTAGVTGYVSVGSDSRLTPTVTPTVGSYTYTGSAQGPNAATNTGTGTTYTYSYVGVSPTTYTASATRPINAGTYTVTATVAANGSYAQASSSATAFSITAKGLTVTGLTGTNKVYNGTTAATATGTAALSGVISPDVVTLGGTPSFTFASANVGTAISISTTGYSLSGAAAANYILTQPTLSANITVETPTVTPTVGSYTYSGAAQGPNAATNTGTGTTYTYSYVGVSPTSYTASATAPTNAGTYTVTVTVAANGNYAQASSSATAFSIAAKALTVTGLTGTNKVYDGTTSAAATGTTALSGILLSQTVTLSGTPSYTFASSNVGTAISISTTGYTIIGAAAVNYSLTQPTFSANITAKALTVTGLTGTNKVYDGTTSAAATGTAALSGIVLSQTVTLGGTPSYTFASANVGTAISISTTGYTISGASAVNYSLTQPTLSANITVATPTVTPTVGSYTYSGATQGPNTATNTGTGTIYTYSYAGVSPTVYTASATAPINAGTYKVTATVSANGNYAQASSSATAFSITAKALTVTGLTGTNKVYNGTTAATATGTAVLSGVISPDVVTLGGTPSFTFASATVGTAISISTTSYSLSGAAVANYTLTQPTLSANITAKALTVTGVTGTDKVYNGTTAATATGTATLSGVISPDVVTLGGTPSYTFATANVGTTKSISTTGYTLSGANAGNYTLTQPTLSANITQSPLTITANNGTKCVGAIYAVGSGSTAFTSIGLQNSETIGSITIASTGAVSGATAGSYNIVPSLATGGTFTAANYNITYSSGDLTVNPLPSTPTISAGGTITFCDGGSVMLTSSALSGNQWYKDGNLISGATATTYTATTSGNYTVIMNNGTCSSSSSLAKTVTVTAIPAPVLEFTQGGNDRTATIAACGTLVGGGQNDIDIVAGTNPGGTIEWQISSDNGSTWTKAPGPTSTAAAYILDPVYAYFEGVAGAYQFRVQITNNGCTGVSIAPAILTVTGTPNLTAGTIAGDQNSCSASYTPNTFTEATAATGGSVAYTYQWQSSTDNAVFSSITGANAATYSSTALTQTTYFHRIVISGGCSAISNTITVTIGSPVTTGVTICAGGSGTLTSDIVPMDAISTTAAKNPGTASTISGSNWSNPTNISADDTSYATVSIALNNGISGVLSATNYGFSIPTNATIKGVQVAIGRYASSSSSLQDNSVKLIVGGAVTGNNKGATSTNWPITTIAAANYGSTTDLWGATLTPAIINASNFGVSLSIDNVSTTNSRTASVDYMQITVTYSLPGTLDWFTAASGGTSIGSGTSFNPVGVANSGLANTNTAGTTSYYAECSSSPGCRTKTDFVINATPSTTSYSITQPTLALATGSVNFTGLPASGMIYYGGTIGVAITGTAQTISGLVSGTYSFTISNGTPCTFIISGLIINAAPTISVPSVGTITLPTCAVQTGSVVLSGLPAGNWTINPGSITGSTTSTTISGLAAGTYNFTVTNASNYTSLASVDVVIPSLVNNSFNNGVWSHGTPTVDQNINLISGTIDTDITACSCKVLTNSSVIVQSGKTVTLTNEITVQPNGYITFEDTASLVQINDVVNSGHITYQRTSSALANNYDFVYWSSPVKDQEIGTIWMASNWADTFYNFNPSVNNWARNAAANTMEVGKGYIARARNGQSGLDYNGVSSTFTVGGTWTAKFHGVPNNGTITSSNVVSNSYCLLGNPYPSAMDADAFLYENRDRLDGTLYFWTHNTAIANNKYNSSDYASYNFVGGVATAAQANNGGGLNNNIPTGKIAAGQAFFATAKTSGTVAFDNSMRVAGVTSTSATNNSQFFKTTANKKTASKFEKNRIWLNLSNTQGVFKQTLVGYVTGATNGFEKSFDGESMNGNTYADFYSINDNKNLTIQGRALPFDTNDTVPLGFRTTISGDFKINIDQVDGLLTNQAVFIEDKLTNTVFDLKSGDYTFTTVAGTFNDRFVLRYVNKTLGTDSFSTKENQVLVSNKNKQIKINSATETIDKVIVYDLLGRVVCQKNNVSNTEFLISNLVSSNQTLLVKTILENGLTVTHKIIF